MPEDIQKIEVPTQKCGTIKLFVQGSLAEKQGKTVFLTIHDIGSNHRSFIDFVNQPCMAEVKSKSVFLHVCVPGQDDGDPDLDKLCTLSEFGEDLVCVLDQIQIKTCVVFGEGAGANIACRFAFAFPNRVLGICLVHCTSTTAGVLEYIKDKMMSWRSGSGTPQQAREYLVTHKFGPLHNRYSRLNLPGILTGSHRGADDRSEHVKNYIENLEKLNPKNVGFYIESFLKRTDLSQDLSQKLKMDVLLVVGSKASHVHTVYTMHQAMPREKATLLVVDGVGDVTSEAPDRLTRALVLYCKGCGVLSGVSMPGMERQRTLSSSMEEADKPRRLSVTNQ